MKFKIHNRFKSLVGGLLAINLLFVAPAMASIQDSTATAAQVEQQGSEAPDDAAALNTDSAASDVTAAPDSATAVAASSDAKASPAAATVKEEKVIDPQVYKNLTYYILLFLVICTV